VSAPDSDTLARAVESNFIETWWLLAGRSGAECHQQDGLRWFAGGDHPILNAVIETNRPDGIDERLVERVAGELRARAGSCVWWQLPVSAPADLATRLRAAGFAELGKPWPGMAAELERVRWPTVPADVALERVSGVGQLDEYLSIFEPVLSPGPAFAAAMRRAAVSIGFEPNAAMAHYLARVGGRAVACASLIVAGGSAGLYNVATIEAARGRGIGAAVSAAALREALERRVPIATLQASEMGYRVYERLGFREVCQLQPHLLPPPTAGS